MAECYLCGRYIQRGQGYRRRVQVGDSSGVSFGRRSIRAYSGVRHGPRTVCSYCASAVDAQREHEEKVARIAALVIGGIVIFFLLLLLIGISVGGSR